MLSEAEAEEESERMMNNSGLDLVIINSVQYSLEFAYYVTGWILMVSYLILSNAAYRFHVQLRILLLCLIGGMLGVGGCRLFLAPLRIIYAHELPLHWMRTYDYWFHTLHLCFVMLIDTSIFAISIERLIAATYVKTYEHMFMDWLPVSTTWVVHGGANILICYVLFFANGDPYLPQNLSTLSYVALGVMGSNVLGMIFLLTAFRISKQHLQCEDRHLSQSFQCKENLQVVNVVLPIYILLFFTRIVQMLSMLLSIEIGFQIFNAFWMRIILHGYNQALGLAVLFTAFLLIWLQPALRQRFFICRRRKVQPEEHESSRRDQKARETNYYFQSLQKSWELP